MVKDDPNLLRLGQDGDYNQVLKISPLSRRGNSSVGPSEQTNILSIVVLETVSFNNLSVKFCVSALKSAAHG